MTEDVCTACGERNPAGSAFCLYCGVYLGWDEAATEETTQESATARPAVHQAAGEPSAVASPTQSHAGPAARTSPATATPYEDVSSRLKPGEVSCPQCGTANAGTLRFCSKCGTPLRPSGPTSQMQTAVVRQSWWRRFWDPKDRRARRDYRKSLPPLYRWRRVIVGVGGIAVVAVVLSVVGKNPVGWGKDRFYDLRGALVVVDPVTFAGSPPQSVAKGYDAAALGTTPLDDAWGTAWDPTKLVPLDGCPGRTATPGMVSLTFTDPVRVRRLDVRAGLPDTNSKRTLQFRPSVLLVMYEGHCDALPVKDVADLQKLKLDTKVPVKQLLIAVGATYAGRKDGAEKITSLTSLTVQSRPR